MTLAVRLGRERESYTAKYHKVIWNHNDLRKRPCCQIGNGCLAVNALSLEPIPPWPCSSTVHIPQT